MGPRGRTLGRFGKATFASEHQVKKNIWKQRSGEMDKGRNLREGSQRLRHSCRGGMAFCSSTPSGNQSRVQGQQEDSGGHWVAGATEQQVPASTHVGVRAEVISTSRVPPR